MTYSASLIFKSELAQLLTLSHPHTHTLGNFIEYQNQFAYADILKLSSYFIVYFSLPL